MRRPCDFVPPLKITPSSSAVKSVARVSALTSARSPRPALSPAKPTQSFSDSKLKSRLTGKEGAERDDDDIWSQRANIESVGAVKRLSAINRRNSVM
jgi:hypothetical protein